MHGNHGFSDTKRYVQGNTRHVKYNKREIRECGMRYKDQMFRVWQKKGPGMLTNYASEYKSKLKTPEEAVKIVKDGDWIDYSGATGQPVLLDKALAARRDELHNVNIRGYMSLYRHEVAECDPSQEHFCRIHDGDGLAGSL